MRKKRKTKPAKPPADRLATAVIGSTAALPANQQTAPIAEWSERWLEIVEQQTPDMFAFARELRDFGALTNYLASQCEALDMDSSPLLEFRGDCEQTYFGFIPTLPAVPAAVWHCWIASN